MSDEPKRPTIAELEAILADTCTHRKVEIQPNGEVRSVDLYAHLEAEVATLTRERDAANLDRQKANDYLVVANRLCDKRGKERDAARAEVTRLQGALEAARDSGITDYGDKAGLRKCAYCHKVQRGHEPFVHATDLSPEVEAWKPNLLPVCIRAIRALRPPVVDPTSTPAKKESPGAPIGEARPACGNEEPGQLGLMRYCSQACNDAGGHVAPPDTGVRPGLRPADIHALAVSYAERNRTGPRYGINAVEDIINEALEADRRSR